MRVLPVLICSCACMHLCLKFLYLLPTITVLHDFFLIQTNLNQTQNIRVLKTFFILFQTVVLNKKIVNFKYLILNYYYYCLSTNY